MVWLHLPGIKSPATDSFLDPNAFRTMMTSSQPGLSHWYMPDSACTPCSKRKYFLWLQSSELPVFGGFLLYLHLSWICAPDPSKVDSLEKKKKKNTSKSVSMFAHINWGKEGDISGIESKTLVLLKGNTQSLLRLHSWPAVSIWSLRNGLSLSCQDLDENILIFSRTIKWSYRKQLFSFT